MNLRIHVSPCSCQLVCEAEKNLYCRGWFASGASQRGFRVSRLQFVNFFPHKTGVTPSNCHGTPIKRNTIYWHMLDIFFLSLLPSFRNEAIIADALQIGKPRKEVDSSSRSVLLLSLLLLVVALNVGYVSTQNTLSSLLSTFSLGNVLGASQKSVFVESKIAVSAPSLHPGLPRLAYLISGSKGDGQKLKRTLTALYHPLNQYIVHLDLEASPKERVDLAEYVKSNPIFADVGNVHMVSKANLVTYKGPTMVTNTLHAIAILLRRSKEWDWFINLSASDYPLVTQDDLLHTFSSFPRDFNFIEHTSDLAWKVHHRAKPIIIDPGFYRTKKSDIFWVTERRDTPTAFKLFTGSAWMALSRAFVEYCIWGWDNLPRTVLMYYANFVSSPEGYFHTVICNTKEFKNTTINHDLHYISWDNPPKQHPHVLGLSDSRKMIDSNAPFARKFPTDDPVLDKIDRELLQRLSGRFTPGGWCIGSRENGSDPCSVMGDRSVLKPGEGAKRLQVLMKKLLAPQNIKANQCK